MVRFVSTISTFLLLFAPLAAAAQQLTLDQIVQQLFPQGVQGIQSAQATSTIGLQLQQNLTQFLPIAQQYLDVLNPQAGDTEAIVTRLEMMLKDPKFNVALQGVASTTLQAVAANPNQPVIDTLLGQVATIQQQIDALIAAGQAAAPAAPPAPQAQVQAEGGAVIECPNIVRNLLFGLQGNDIINLQVFLIEEGLLEAGNATGFFGKLTEAAVQAWQKAKAIVLEGDPLTTGFGAVGPKTRAALLNCR